MYSFSSRVRYSECDKNANLTIAGLINYIQDTAILHAEDAGVGLDYMIPRNLGWFVTTYHLELKSLPHLGEAIKVNTYPYGFRGFIGNRAYTVENSAGQIIAVCNSTWALMDLVALRPVHASDDMIAAYGISDAPEGTPSSIRLRPEADLVTIGSFKVTTDMLDTNDHVNNGKYITMMQQYLPEDFSFNDLKIAYKKALHLGDEVQVRAYTSEHIMKLYFFYGEDLSCIGEFATV